MAPSYAAVICSLRMEYNDFVWTYRSVIISRHVDGIHDMSFCSVAECVFVWNLTCFHSPLKAKTCFEVAWYYPLFVTSYLSYQSILLVRFPLTCLCFDYVITNTYVSLYYVLCWCFMTFRQRRKRREKNSIYSYKLYVYYAYFTWYVPLA